MNLFHTSFLVMKLLFVNFRLFAINFSKVSLKNKLVFEDDIGSLGGWIDSHSEGHMSERHGYAPNSHQTNWAQLKKDSDTFYT